MRMNKHSEFVGLVQQRNDETSVMEQPSDGWEKQQTVLCKQEAMNAASADSIMQQAGRVRAEGAP